MQGVNCAFFRAGVKFYVFKRAASPFFSCPGMLIAGFCGLSITTLQTQLGYEEQPWAKGAAVIMSIMMMKNILGTVHPPAASYAYLMVTSNLGPLGFIAPGPAGALV